MWCSLVYNGYEYISIATDIISVELSRSDMFVSITTQRFLISLF